MSECSPLKNIAHVCCTNNSISCLEDQLNFTYVRDEAPKLRQNERRQLTEASTEASSLVDTVTPGNDLEAAAQSVRIEDKQRTFLPGFHEADAGEEHVSSDVEFPILCSPTMW